MHADIVNAHVKTTATITGTAIIVENESVCIPCCINCSIIKA